MDKLKHLHTKDIKSRACNMILLSFLYFHVNVVVQFCSWFNFYFPLFLCMVVYDNENNPKGNKNWTNDKTEPQHKRLWHQVNLEKSQRLKKSQLLSLLCFDIFCL